MITTKAQHFKLICLALIWVMQGLPAFAQTEPNSSEISLPTAQSSAATVVPVAFPAPFSAPRGMPIAPLPVPVPLSVPKMVQPNAGVKSEHEKLIISQMNGEVHFKHLQGPHIDPARALCVETGKSADSWAECQMQDCTIRVGRNSQATLFPDTGVVCLERGALIVRVKRGTESKYAVIAGDYMCRVQSTVLRVQRGDSGVNFQVLEGNVTVYNRQSGELLNVAPSVTQPARRAAQ